MLKVEIISETLTLEFQMKVDILLLEIRQSKRTESPADGIALPCEYTENIVDFCKNESFQPKNIESYNEIF